MTGSGGADEIVEKLMSIRRDEFEAGLTRLAGISPQRDGQNGYVLTSVQGEVQTISFSFKEQSDAVLGHLLKLPRAKITLHLGSLSTDARSHFLALFDRTFQRGGG
jgi:hypothetical protein